MRLYLLLRRAEVWLTLAILATVVGLVGWATLTRYLGVPNVWVIEVTQAFFAWLCLLSASVAFRSGSHFSVDLIVDRLGPALQPWLSVFRTLVLFLLLAALAWVSLDYVEISHRRRLPLTGIRFSWVASAFTVACVMMMLTCIENLVRAWPRRPAGEANA